jgi:hypothetical protein
MIKLFLAHAKDTQLPELKELVAALHAVVAKKNPGTAFSITTGRDDYLTFGEKLGWDAWCESVAKRFDVIVVPATPVAFELNALEVGQATAKIVEAARQKGKRTRAFCSDMMLVPFLDIVAVSFAELKLNQKAVNTLKLQSVKR